MSTEEIHPYRIRMEEEEVEPSYPVYPPPSRRPTPRRGAGFRAEPEDVTEPEPLAVDSGLNELIMRLLEERQTILADERLGTKDKYKLLESNRQAMATARGVTIRKTEDVVYGILIFSAVVLIVLALLTTYAGLPADVTLAFVGTTLGGTIATIAQKLGRIGGK